MSTPPTGPIGHAMQLFRLHRGLSLRALARQLGCSHNYLLEVEAGEKTVSADMANRLKALGFVEIDDMVLAHSLLRVVRSARGGT